MRHKDNNYPGSTQVLVTVADYSVIAPVYRSNEAGKYIRLYERCFIITRVE
jgi:hypothetical protein